MFSLYCIGTSFVLSHCFVCREHVKKNLRKKKLEKKKITLPYLLDVPSRLCRHSRKRQCFLVPYFQDFRREMYYLQIPCSGIKKSLSQMSYKKMNEEKRGLGGLHLYPMATASSIDAITS